MDTVLMLGDKVRFKKNYTKYGRSNADIVVSYGLSFEAEYTITNTSYANKFIQINAIIEGPWCRYRFEKVEEPSVIEVGDTVRITFEGIVTVADHKRGRWEMDISHDTTESYSARFDMGANPIILQKAKKPIDIGSRVRYCNNQTGVIHAICEDEVWWRPDGYQKNITRKLKDFTAI